MTAAPVPPSTYQPIRVATIRERALEAELARVTAIFNVLVDDALDVADEYIARIAALSEEIDDQRRQLNSYECEVKALQRANEARERTIVRQLQEIRSLRRSLARREQHTITPTEAFRATHPIETVIGAVVDLAPAESLQADLPMANAIREAVGLPQRTDSGRAYLVGRCPFHRDEHPSPSLVVRPYHGQFACYVCGTAGDVVRFLQLYESKGAA